MYRPNYIAPHDPRPTTTHTLWLVPISPGSFMVPSSLVSHLSLPYPSPPVVFLPLPRL